MWKKSFKIRFLVFIFVLVMVFFSTYISVVTLLPGEMTLIEGEEYIYNLRYPLKVSILADKEGVIKLNGRHVGVGFTSLSLHTPVSIQSSRMGNVNLRLKLFGLLPLRTLKVDTIPNARLIPCGNTVGVKIQTKGVLIIALSDLDGMDGKKYEPGKDAGLKVGDIIIEIDHKPITEINELIQAIDDSEGKLMQIKYKRGEEYYIAQVKPVKSVEDKKLHMGLWVRDSTAGIGTMTFYDPTSRMYGALGHGITDMDTGSLLSVDKGEILHSSILSIKKGQKGKPGELKGVFLENRNKIGNITQNTEYGIYGNIYEEALQRFNTEPMPIALRTQVKEGPAIILSNIEGDKVEAFQVEIEKVSRQNTNNSKGMVIRITDERLLRATGGIVQGMSGSPIIQGNKIVGAVTHVLVNKPDTGYGIFVEWMLQNMNKAQAANMEGIDIVAG